LRHRYFVFMRTSGDGTRDRLREIESELIEIAMTASMPSERDYAEALMHEVRRIERNVTGNATAR
jgi:hypothetical protein